MTGLLRKAALLASVGVLAASGVMAAVPYAPNCTVPCGLALLAKSAGGTAITSPVASAGPYRAGITINVKDQATNAIAGSLVCINFTGCAGVATAGNDTKIATPQAPGLTVDCLPAPGPADLYQGTVCAVTDGAGNVTMTILGGASHTGVNPNPDGADFQCGRVYADGVLLGPINVAAYDLTGNGAVQPADISSVVQDALKFTAPPPNNAFRGRSDFDCGHTIGPPDITAVVTYSFVGGVGVAVTYCVL